MSRNSTNLEISQKLEMEQAQQLIQTLPQDSPMTALFTMLTNNVLTTKQVLNTVPELKAKLAQYEKSINELTARNKELEKKNAALMAKVDQMKQTTPSSKVVQIQKKPASTTTATRSAKGTQASSWANMAKKYRPDQQRTCTMRKYDAAIRAFQPMDPDAPKGYDYIYIPRSHRMSYREARAKLRTIGIDTYRVLDITFPAKDTFGILIHAQYKEELLATLKQAKIKALSNFDPLDPKHIADPKHVSKTTDEKVQMAMQLNLNRCSRAIARMRFHIAVNVGKSFVEHGFMDRDTLSEALEGCAGYVPHRDDPQYDGRNTPMEEDDDEAMEQGSTHEDQNE